MDFRKGIGLCVAAMAAMAAGHADAASLSFVSVRAPVHCLFNVPCVTTAAVETSEAIEVSNLVWSGTARLQTRTFKAALGTPAGEKDFYEYRLDLTQAVSDADPACITDLSIDFGPVLKLQYNNAGPLDDVYVVFQAGAAAIGLFAVDQTNEVVTFTFSQPICAGATPGTGQASRFFGLASALPPRDIVATVSVPGLGPVNVKARAPARRKP